MAENKTKITEVTVSAFLDSVIAREDAEKVIGLMRRVTGEEAKMWGPSIIGFGSYHYRLESGREGDMPVVGFSPRKTGLVFYIGQQEVQVEGLGKHTTGKGCLYVKKLSDVNLEVLEALLVSAVKNKTH